MESMKLNRFALPAMSEINLSITHIIIDENSPLNHNESHIHKECEIYINLSGNVSFEVENHIYPISRGSVIITRPMEYHHCIYNFDEPHNHYWITFSPKEEEHFLTMFFNRNRGEGNLIILSEKQLKECETALDKLLEEESDPLSRRIEFCTLLKILNESQPLSSSYYADTLPRDVSAALRFMDEHLTEDLEMKAISDFCNVSINTLERHFKKHLGITPFAMLRKKRLIFSMVFLRNGESVTDAAIKSGFCDYSNYIQLFRKQFGFTPLEYKKKFGHK